MDVVILFFIFIFQISELSKIKYRLKGKTSYNPKTKLEYFMIKRKLLMLLLFMFEDNYERVNHLIPSQIKG